VEIDDDEEADEAAELVEFFSAMSEPSDCDELSDNGACAETCEKLCELVDFVMPPLPLLLWAFVVVCGNCC
jgi:hypothetical protein